MLSNRFLLLATTALAPVLWGTTYLTTTALLPADRPLLAAFLRALPAGLLLLVLCRRLPRGEWWWKSWVLGVLNIGAFFALLFIAAYRLPGGVAAIVGGLQPLVVALLASRVLHERMTGRVLASGATGAFGVSLIVLQSQARLDAIGILAAVGGTVCMASGIVLSKKWGQPAPLLATTSWQLIAGGLSLLPVLLLLEGLPTTPLTVANLAGYAYLAVAGTALAYVAWFHGIARLPASTIAFLGLLSPVVAIVLGWAIAGEHLAPIQIAGIVIVLGSIAAVIVARTPKRGFSLHRPRFARGRARNG
ncbi:probable blue pigment (indigoidine) exporter [Cryobacterium flavum]|uniref:EamA family transporter n=1 Tax=Cryobacterium flavum TaxID=1424659 RepID=A0A4R8VCA9_9MICO|nr:EamA family transporter [Cryobacterium flavum]TFB80991.1 EamA family transporter [Cryobacterium flavum]SDM81990.1 probable blue pigment (indigoidine) exporter [Cryobacterium flavum]